MFKWGQKTYFFFIATWCNGITTDFDSVCIGSNPVVVTIFKKVRQFSWLECMSVKHVVTGSSPVRTANILKGPVTQVVE